MNPTIKKIVEMAFMNRNIDPERAKKEWNLKDREEMFLDDHKHISDVGDHEIHHGKYLNSDQNVYYAKHKKTGRIHLTMNCEEHGDNVHIDTMSKHPASTIKMHDFIHHLIHHHNKSIGAAEFTEGGKHVMEKLKTMPNTKLNYFKNHQRIKTPVAPYDEPKPEDKKDPEQLSKVSYIVATKKTH